MLCVFEMYPTGQPTDRTIAEWLNVQSQRTTRGRPFGADTVRDMLCNATYCGYVSGQRDRTKAIKGLHEAIVPEELFDRVQELRRQRARTLKPGRPSNRYVLRGLAYCRRRHAKMQGTGVGRNHVARYYCSTRRKSHGRDQSVVPADEAERQLVQFITGFKPEPTLREEILRRLATADTGPESSETIKRRTGLRSAFAVCATCTSLATSSEASISPDATRSTPSLTRSRRSPRPGTRAQRARRLHDLLEHRDRARRQASLPHAHIRGSLAGRTPRRRGPAQALIPALLRVPHSSGRRSGDGAQRAGATGLYRPRGTSSRFGGGKADAEHLGRSAAEPAAGHQSVSGRMPHTLAMAATPRREESRFGSPRRSVTSSRQPRPQTAKR